jgi:hypothetical protein
MCLGQQVIRKISEEVTLVLNNEYNSGVSSSAQEWKAADAGFGRSHKGRPQGMGLRQRHHHNPRETP